MRRCDDLVSAMNLTRRSRIRSKSFLGVRKRSKNCTGLYDFWSSSDNKERECGQSEKNRKSDNYLKSKMTSNTQNINTGDKDSAEQEKGAKQKEEAEEKDKKGGNDIEDQMESKKWGLDEKSAKE